MVERRNRIHALTQAVNAKVRHALKNRNFVYAVVARLAALVERDPDAFIFDFVVEAQNRFEESIIKSTFSTAESAGIPRLRHRIWITDPQNPSLPSQAALQGVAAEMQAQDDSGWRNLFWTNSAAVEQTLRDAFNGETARVTLRSLGEFADDPAYPTLQKLIADGKYVLACDVARILVVNREGGLYTDLRVHVEKGILDAIEIADYAVVLSESAFFQSSLFAARAGSKITELMTAVFVRPEAIPAKLVRARNVIGPVDEVNLFAGPGLTLLLLAFLSRAERLLVLVADGQTVRWSAERSWYGETKFGNADLAASAASVISEAKYEEFDALRAQSVSAFGKVGLLALQLQILVGLSDLFPRKPTRLCRILYHNGSDKALAWHNYSLIYYHLLHDFVGAAPDLLEVGIGTNHLDVPSTMGVTGVPGASLRSWREFFINGTVHGADVDRRILFEEPGISTSFVDQTDVATIDAMWAQIGKRFDIVIDDGLHLFSANRQFYERSGDHARKGGWFVVEDVMFHEIEAWKTYIAERELDAAIVKIPNEKNKNDNCLVIFPVR